MFKTEGVKKAILIGNTYNRIKINRNPIPSEGDLVIMEGILKKIGFNMIEKEVDSFPKIAIEKFLRDAKDGDLLFIFFSGHGGELVGAPKYPGTDLLSSWINPDGSYFLSYELDTVLSEFSKNCKIILCSDTCYAGKFMDHYKGKNKIYYIGASKFNPTGSYLLEEGETKTGALALLFKYMFNDKTDIEFNDIEHSTRDFRKKKRFLQGLTLKEK